MKLLCPNCHAPLNESYICKNNHRFKIDDGVLILLREEFSEKLNPGLRRFSEIRKNKLGKYLKPQDYPFLPYGDAVSGNVEWRIRQFDWEILLPLLKDRKGQRVLEIGPYNGWLTHRMAKLQLEITAIDYFIDDLDGLKTKKYYREEWKSIQMDIRDLAIIDERFDIIVVNRCLQFFEDPIEYFGSLKGKISQNGMIILTGLQFFKNPQQKRKLLEKIKSDFKQKHDFNFMLVPFKGYLDFEDKQKLSSQNVDLQAYPKLRLSNLKSFIKPLLPRHYFGAYHI
jgi:2-polyprenyl-3-methyl-5-hydroxy-6-metoxy-1,4-benzoquinol methylase